MLTGATLFDYTDKYTTRVFFQKRFAKTVIPFVFWGVFALICMLVNNPESVLKEQLGLDMIFNGIFAANHVSVFWFFIPLFANIPKDKKLRIFSYLACVAFILNVFAPFVADLANAFFNWSIVWKYSVPALGECLKRYYGVTNIIWIKGLKNEDVTDGYIDACVKFAEGNKLVPLPYDDFMWYCAETEKDWKTVTNAKNAEGVPYEIVEIPLTETFYEELEDYGCYLNYYVGNEVVLVPVYGDVNDQVAMDIIAGLYPTRKVVGINCLDLALFGGMVHCVTQQQPALDVIASAD